MVSPSTFFSTLIMGTATSLSIILVFVISVYGTRRTMAHEMNIRFEEEVRELSEEYYAAFENFSTELMLIEHDAIDERLAFNAATETGHLSRSKVQNWSKNKENTNLAGAYGHILLSLYSLEAFFASPYIEYKKKVFDNLGDHLLEARSCLWNDNVRREIICNSGFNEEKYDRFVEKVDDLIDKWIRIDAKNYTEEMIDEATLFSILHTCKWLFVIGIILPFLLLISVPSSFLEGVFGNMGENLPIIETNFVEVAIFCIQLSILSAVVILAWKLLKDVHSFFTYSGFPESPDVGLDDVSDESIPSVPQHLFEE